MLQVCPSGTIGDVGGRIASLVSISLTFLFWKYEISEWRKALSTSPHISMTSLRRSSWENYFTTSINRFTVWSGSTPRNSKSLGAIWLSEWLSSVSSSYVHEMCLRGTRTIYVFSKRWSGNCSQRIERPQRRRAPSNPSDTIWSNSCRWYRPVSSKNTSKACIHERV